MRACDVVTIPWPWTEFSAYYTSPMKLFEYMAANVPIVATDLPAIREVLSHGENAWLVAPGDAKTLADGIYQVLSDRPLAERLAHQARRQAYKYSWNERASTILDALRHNELFGAQ
jgi:glycosyltransferase involved in cell wall biosynthesis